MSEATARPVILTVDDDPGVSRAVARDLRRRYGDAYRVVRAESGGRALEALEELKLRGARVAALLADDARACSGAGVGQCDDGHGARRRSGLTRCGGVGSVLPRPGRNGRGSGLLVGSVGVLLLGRSRVPGW